MIKGVVTKDILFLFPGTMKPVIIDPSLTLSIFQNVEFDLLHNSLIRSIELVLAPTSGKARFLVITIVP